MAEKAKRPALAAELKAMGREALKDVNNTMHQVFFGQQVAAGSRPAVDAGGGCARVDTAGGGGCSAAV